MILIELLPIQELVLARPAAPHLAILDSTSAAAAVLRPALAQLVYQGATAAQQASTDKLMMQNT